MSELFPAPDAGFDDPVEMLDACHQRIRRQCATIARLAEHLARDGADAEARVAARGVLRYFGSAGRNHHLDEEADLFPALLAAATAAERGAVEALVAHLLREHRVLDVLWDDMRSRLEAIDVGVPVELPEAAARAFGAAYETHIRCEEEELLPLARRILAPEALDALGASMAKRRGVRFPGGAREPGLASA